MNNTLFYLKHCVDNLVTVVLNRLNHSMSNS